MQNILCFSPKLSKKFDEKTFGVRLKHPVTNDPPSAAQQAAQTKLAAVAAQAKAELADPAKKAEHKAKFRKKRKHPTLIGYVYHQVFEQLNTNQP